MRIHIGWHGINHFAYRVDRSFVVERRQLGRTGLEGALGRRGLLSRQLAQVEQANEVVPPARQQQVGVGGVGVHVRDLGAALLNLHRGVG